MPDLPRVEPPDWVPGDPLAARRLQLMTDAIRQAQGYAGEYRQSDSNPFPPIISVRFVLTDANRALTGLGTLDGSTIRDKDLILRATGGTPGNDGIFEAGNGAWLMVWRLNDDQAPITAHRLPHGTQVNVWDGTSGKGQIYMASLDQLATF